MIDDLSKTLRAVLSEQTDEAAKRRGRLPAELVSAQIVFDRPSDTFNPQQTTVDVFLYDVRENLELRSNAPLIQRNNPHVITHRAPLRVACSYLVTAWPVGGVDLTLQEQRLLGQVLQIFSRLPTIPDSFVQGTLKGQKPPLPMVTALVDPQKNMSEFWTALGSQLRPSLTVTATFAMEAAKPETASMVLTEDLRFTGGLSLAEQTSVEAEEIERFIRIAGQVTGATNKPIAGATVRIVEVGREGETDKMGRFTLGVIERGSYTLRVVAGRARRDLAIKVPADKDRNYDVQLM